MVEVKHLVCCYCGGCVGLCPQNALELRERMLDIDNQKCVECGICVNFCPVGALKEGKNE